MVENIKLKEKSNKIEIIGNSETLAAVYTVYCHSVDKSNVKNEEYINKDRAMIFLKIIGLSLCVFLCALRYRAGPIGNNIIIKSIKGMRLLS